MVNSAEQQTGQGRLEHVPENTWEGSPLDGEPIVKTTGGGLSVC